MRQRVVGSVGGLFGHGGRSLQSQRVVGHPPHLQAAAGRVGSRVKVCGSGSRSGPVVEPRQEPGETKVHTSYQVGLLTLL